VGRDGLEGIGDAVPEQQLRAAVARHVADVGERRIEVRPELVDRDPVALGGRLLGEQAHVDPDAHQALLGTVMEVALDALAFEVDRVEGAHPGPAQVALEREALEPEPDQATDRERQRQELEGRALEGREQHDGDRDEDDPADDEEAPERAQRPASGDERQR
jgi:hypothetical protein